MDNREGRGGKSGRGLTAENGWAANPAFVQEFMLFQPLPDAIPVKVHP